MHYTQQCTICFKERNTLRKRHKYESGKKHYRTSLCFCKVNELLLIIPLIFNNKVSIELARCDSLKRCTLSLFWYQLFDEFVYKNVIPIQLLKIKYS